MTVEQIEEQIKKLQEQKKEKLKQEKAKQIRIEQQKKAQKRKIESRVKYIIGGYILSVSPDYIDKIINSDKLREQDRKTLMNYKENL